MPIYAYQCQQCEQRFETLVMRSNETVTCPNCGSEELQKLITAAAITSGTPETPCGSAPCGGGMCSPTGCG
jgi:putative FmdB family regulatory protein